MKKELQKRRGIILAFLGFLCVISVKAQTWTAPTFEHQTDDLSSQVGEVFYLYNVGSNAYLTYGASYGTRAVMGPVGYPMYLRQSGLNYKFEFVTSPKHDGKTYDLFDAGSGNVFTDNTTNSDWTCTYDATSKSYTIANIVAPTLYFASKSTTTANTNAGNGYKSGGNFYFALDNIATNDDYAKWRFVTPKQKALLDLSNLFTYVTNNPSLGIDLTSYIAIYDNVASVTTDLTTALTNLKNAIYATATTSNPVEITNFAIANPSFEFKSVSSLDSWVVSAGSLAPANSAEISGTFPEAGSSFVEYYQGSGNVPALTIQQAINSLPAGKYSLKAIIKGAANGSTSPANIKLFAGSFNTSITTMPTTATKYEVQDIISDGSALNIGIQYTTGANWFAADYFQLYYYGPVSAISTSKSQLAFNGSDNYLSDSLTVSGFNLTGSISISSPAGITVSPTTLASDASNAKVYVTYDGTTAVSGNIAFTSGSTTTNVAVTGSATTGCFTPLFSTGNLIPDAHMNSFTGFSNWGNVSIVTGSEAYCGSSCAKITGTGDCYPNGGSISKPITWKPNTTYREKVMVKTVDGSFAIGHGKTFCATSHVDGNLVITIPQTTDAWVQIDTTFVTGASAGTDAIYFANCDATGTHGRIAYIDNWELYEISSLPTSHEYVSGFNNQSVYVKGNAIVADFELAQSANVEISVFNAQGMLLNKTIGSFNAGKNSKVVDVNLTSGLYLVKLTQNGKSITTKVIR
jgi:hypothetical protein